ncbi:MAG: hypothetical protein AB7V46_18000 [Thermomicrobiales bacterium]
MNQMKDTVWQRRGISWIWDGSALSAASKPAEVVSLRQWLRMRGQWSDELPSGDGSRVVVAGLDGGLDLLAPQDAESWLGGEVKETILSFQAYYDSDAALIFWLPEGKRRLHIHTASDVVTWQCAPPNASLRVDFGRLLWGEAREYPQELLLPNSAEPAGLFHLRIT